MIMTIMSLFFSSIYLMGSNPVLFLALILAQSLLICIMSWIKLKISWFSYILFLIFLGGLMVLFIYITSLASNEKISLNFFTYKYFLFMSILMLSSLIFLFKDQLFLEEKFFFMKTFNNMYSTLNSSMIIIAMIYLLLTLIIAVKIANKFNAPIKNMILTL